MSAVCPPPECNIQLYRKLFMSTDTTENSIDSTTEERSWTKICVGILGFGKRLLAYTVSLPTLPSRVRPTTPIFPPRAAKKNYTFRVRTLWRDMLAKKVVLKPISASPSLPRLEAAEMGLGQERRDSSTSDAIIDAESMANLGYSHFFSGGLFNGERATDGVVQPRHRPKDGLLSQFKKILRRHAQYTELEYQVTKTL
ncbi:hypothetical protein B0H11DRAFT_1934534 [Mycena galericulata]|nr:hypothetical protein B0H11DRAFT_1934534 [Mycena galericulata]